MKTLANTFFKGLIFTLPAFITFGLIYWLFSTAEQLFRIPLELVLPEGWYITGMGVISAVLLVFSIGLLAQAYLINSLFAWMESVVERIPFVKTLYTSAKDFLSFLTGNNGQEMRRVVRVTMDNGIHVITASMARAEKINHGRSKKNSLLTEPAIRKNVDKIHHRFTY